MMRGYTIAFTIAIIQEYIYRLKGVRVVITDPLSNLKLFETAATYALQAYEGSWKLKTNGSK